MAQRLLLLIDWMSIQRLQSFVTRTKLIVSGTKINVGHCKSLANNYFALFLTQRIAGRKKVLLIAASQASHCIKQSNK